MTAAHCEVKLHGFRRTQDGVVVSFVVHPSEVPQCLALDPLGQRYMIGIAAIGDDEQPTNAAARPGASDSRHDVPPAAVVPGRAENRDATIVKRAGILSSDKRFWAWINVADAEAAAAFIRRACAVESRRDLATNTGAAIRFQGLLDEFEASTGRRAEMRG